MVFKRLYKASSNIPDRMFDNIREELNGIDLVNINDIQTTKNDIITIINNEITYEDENDNGIVVNKVLSLVKTYINNLNIDSSLTEEINRLHYDNNYGIVI